MIVEKLRVKVKKIHEKANKAKSIVMHTISRMYYAHKKLGAMAVIMLLLVLLAVSIHTTTQLVNKVSIFENSGHIFEYNNTTFVRYDTAPIDTVIFTAASCERCAETTQQLVTELQKNIPTLRHIEYVDIDTEEGQDRADANGITYIPMAQFSGDVVETHFYEEASQFFVEHDDTYVFYAHALGFEPVQYLHMPAEDDALIREGKEPQFTLYYFTDVDCAFCKTANDIATVVSQKYASTFRIVTFLTADNNDVAKHVNRAVFCADAQHKGAQFLNYIFGQQGTWKKAADLDTTLQAYARVFGLDAEAFNACRNSEDVHARQEQHERIFDDFGVVRIPTIFIDGERYDGVQTFADIDKDIQEMMVQ